MVNRNFRGWVVEYYNGNIINESQMEWIKIPKVGIKRLMLFHDGRSWTIEGKNAYFQKKRASVVPGVENSFQIESRTIGYYEGSNKVGYTVDENTGTMRMEVLE